MGEQDDYGDPPPTWAGWLPDRDAAILLCLALLLGSAWGLWVWYSHR